MKKKLFAAMLITALVLTVALAVCGCSTGSSGSYSARAYAHSMTDNGAVGTYSMFDGVRRYDKELKSGDTITVTLTTTSGTMKVTVDSPGGTNLLTAEEDGTFTCTADVDGKFTVTFSGSNHAGGYTLSW